MSLYLKKCLRPMGTADLERVLGWRNHTEVRHYMYSQREISLDEHICWFEKASQDPRRHLLIYESDALPLGFINIHEVAEGGVADWGFYAAPDSPRGTGRRLGQAALLHVFTELGFHKLCGQALAYNERSIRFHLKMGFMQEGILRQHHFNGQQYHDVVCFGLLADEWQASQ